MKFQMNGEVNGWLDGWLVEFACVRACVSERGRVHRSGIMQSDGECRAAPHWGDCGKKKGKKKQRI
jgi:hypothetical protein